MIGPQTVNTLPLETIDAYRDHGDPKATSRSTILIKQYGLLNYLSELGINIDKITQQLENEGVDKFTQSYDQLIETLKKQLSK